MRFGLDCHARRLARKDGKNSSLEKTEEKEGLSVEKKREGKDGPPPTRGKERDWGEKDCEEDFLVFFPRVGGDPVFFPLLPWWDRKVGGRFGGKS